MDTDVVRNEYGSQTRHSHAARVETLLQIILEVGHDPVLVADKKQTRNSERESKPLSALRNVPSVR